MVGSVADLSDVLVTEGGPGYIRFRLKAIIVEANFTACALNGRAGCRTNFLRCEASLFEDRKCPIFYGHGRKVGMVLLLLVGFPTRIVSRLGWDNSPVVYRNFFHVVEVDGVDII